MLNRKYLINFLTFLNVCLSYYSGTSLILFMNSFRVLNLKTERYSKIEYFLFSFLFNALTEVFLDLRDFDCSSLLHGTVIRIDVDSNTSVPYTIPADNPFVGQDGIRPEIFSYGLRNPWRCGMDRGDKETGPRVLSFKPHTG